MKSKAMVLIDFNKPLQLVEVEVPSLKDGQVLIKIEAAGVCGSDVHMWKGEDPRTPLPIILGHEGIGRIVEVKGNRYSVDGVKLILGDLILWNRGITCGRCFYCKVLNDPSLCPNRKVYGINISYEQPPYLNGCYSEYVILSNDTDVFTVANNVDPGALVSASCSGATIAHAFEMAESKIGSTVLVQGPGPLGIFAVAFAKSLGASQIIVIGGSSGRLNLCREFGATTILNRKDTTTQERYEQVISLTNGKGVDLVIEAAGTQGAVEEGIKYLRFGGTYLSTGYAQPAGIEKIDFFADVVRKNIRIQGVWVSDTRHTFQALSLMLGNQEVFQKLITHRFSLEEANKAIEVMNNREALKAVLIP